MEPVVDDKPKPEPSLCIFFLTGEEGGGLNHTVACVLELEEDGKPLQSERFLCIFPVTGGEKRRGIDHKHQAGARGDGRVVLQPGVG